MDTYENAVLGNDRPLEPQAPQQPLYQAPQQPLHQATQHTSYQPPQQPRYQMPPAGQTPYAAPWQNPYQRPVYTPPVQPSKPKEKKSGGFWKNLLTSVVVAAVSCGITSALLINFYQQRNSNLSASVDERLDVLREEIADNSHIGSGNSVSGSPGPTVEGGLTPAQVYARNVDSVVAIECVVTDYSFGQLVEGMSSGSGFVLTKDGYIVSNYHVVSDAEKITVICNDGTEYAAELIGGDESNDIALLKVEATDLHAATIGNSDALIVGDQVAAIGNPLGELASTLTVGYISAKDRIVTTDGSQINMLQTDAAINPGNSGGPLFNMKGEVIGITTAKYSGTTNSGATIEGIGFAIPIGDVIGMLEDLRQYGYITGAYMGVSVSNVDEATSELYGLPMGVLVHDVSAGSCAQKGGIKAKDIITNLGGYKISNMNDLTRALRKFNAGDTITVTVYRGGAELQLSLTLDEKPQSNS